jgi:xanthine dehydrogenase/oxidase
MMDLGKSLNPAIDIGQIEGAFVQGIGWSLIEESLHLQNGSLFTRGPGNYKIPSFTDIPIDMRVHLFSESENKRAVHSSKAVGEPPLFLGASAYFAVRDAILSARNSATPFLRLDLPATPESIRMACIDIFTKIAKSIPVAAGEKPWAVRA